MAISLLRIGFRSSVIKLEKNAVITTSSIQSGGVPSFKSKRVLHTKDELCNGSFCIIKLPQMQRKQLTCDVNTYIGSDLIVKQDLSVIKRGYSKHHGRPETERRQKVEDSDSDSDSDTECKRVERSDFWRRKMRTLHHLLDVDKDGLISYQDFILFGQRFQDLGHLNTSQAEEFNSILKKTWEEQWGEIGPYNFVTVEQYLEDMNHVLTDKSLKKKAHKFLPYLFKAVDKDKSGFISVKEFKLFFNCLGLTDEQAAVSFAIIDTNGDGVLSLKEFVKLGKEFFFTEDEKRVSRMFWGPLVEK